MGVYPAHVAYPLLEGNMSTYKPLQLTEVEGEVWDMVWKGLTYEQIAEKMHITKSSVRRRLRSARRHLRRVVVV